VGTRDGRHLAVAIIMRVLVIDNESVGRAVQRMLLHGTVTIEPNPAAALGLIASTSDQGSRFGIILCDVEINVRRGADLVRTAREQLEPPVFIFMAVDVAIEHAAWLADGVLLKPFGPHEMFESIGRVMRRRSRGVTRRLRAVRAN
jgi:CheY-like chemotaxis protein